MSKRNKILIPAVGTAALAAASFGGAVAMMRKFACGNHEISVWDENKPSYNLVTSTYDSELWGFTSFDGLKLKAHHFSPKTPSHIYAITVHGYHGNYTDMMPSAQHYLEKGYHVIMPHLRGHGLSEGNYVGFGYHDHYDLCGFIDLIREKDPECRIFLHGISMGAATVMMTAGEYLPVNVKCAIEDAGFTDAFEQCSFNLNKMYHIPPMPTMSVLDMMMRLKNHYSLHDCTPIRSVAHASVPILFIHGDKDDFVPFYMQQPLYEACSSEKDILTVEGAAHVMSIYTDPVKYWEKIDGFVGKYLN